MMELIVVTGITLAALIAGDHLLRRHRRNADMRHQAMLCRLSHVLNLVKEHHEKPGIHQER